MLTVLCKVAKQLDLQFWKFRYDAVVKSALT